MQAPSSERLNLVLVGSGLANCLIALRLIRQNPALNIAIFDAKPVLETNHTWSFHSADLAPNDYEWIRPVISVSWQKYLVKFPDFMREIHSGYHSVRAIQLNQAVQSALGGRLFLKRTAVTVEPHRVEFSDGSSVFADCVIDGRGWQGASNMALGYQKFFGQNITLMEPHGIFFPTLIDATVPQVDGFRFIYLLPWTERQLLVEDTYYSDSDKVSASVSRGEIQDYCRRRGWRIAHVDSEESGVLPIPLNGDLPDWPDGVPRSGMRAMLFHVTTGYSFPFAVSLANLIAHRWPLNSEALFDLQGERSRSTWRRGDYLRFLNRMLFRAAAPEARYKVLQRFYRLPEPLIARFYAGRLAWRDRLRILAGKPPVSVFRAMRCLFEREFD